MRESCLECMMKHWGAAVILYEETYEDYEFHIIYVMGHLNEAASEARHDYPEWAERFRSIRKALLDGEFVDFDQVTEELFALWCSHND